MSKLPTSGLKAPAKVGSKSGLPTRSGLPTPVSSRAQSALEKSARAAGLSTKIAENYAAQVMPQIPGPELEGQMGPVDDYIIGDRVYVGGTKPGHIAFIGETQFAPGEWAGIVLDNPVGKNDGSVAGVRYFQCEPKRGVFARTSKLSRDPINTDSESSATPPPLQGLQDGPGATPATGKTSSKTANGGSVLPPGSRTAMGTKSGGVLTRKSVSGSSTNLAKSSSSGGGSVVDLTPTSSDGGSGKFHMAAGDRVLVSGTKTGILRYIGVTDFAKGDWAGVELDDPLGKNDGAVAGKRYFSCKPMHGLFAPVHKVTKASAGSGPGMLGALGLVTPSPRRGSVPKYGLGMSLSRERSGSQDSISSIGSSASSVSRSRDAVSSHIHRIKSGATPQNAKSSSRPTTLNLSATNTALQKALKEKEEHIEQLLRERDMERSELARAASQVDETENMLLALRNEHTRLVEESEEQINKLRDSLKAAEDGRNKLTNALEEEKRKVEDMQFTIEEEAINKGDLEDKTQNASEMARLTDLEDKIKSEKARCEKMEKDVAMWKQCFQEEKARFKDAEESSVAYLDQIEELTHRESVLQNQIKAMEEAKAQQGSKVSEASEALTAKNEQIAKLEEQLHNSQDSAKKLQSKITEFEEEAQSSVSKSQKQQDTIDDLMKKLALSDTNTSTLTTEIQQVKSQLTDLQRQLTAQEEKSTNLEDDKTKLEEQIAELLANSGDSSQQLTLMSEQLREKERKIEELQAGLSDSTQKVGKLNETIELTRVEAERETDTLLGKHQEDLASFQERIDEKQTELEKTQNKLAKLKEELENENTELKQKKDTEISELKQTLETKETELNTVKTESQGAKDLVQQLTTEKENIKFEKEKSDKQLKKVETERDSLKMECDATKAEKEQMTVEHEKALSSAGVEQEKMKELVAAKAELAEQKLKLEKEKQSGSELREALTKDLEVLRGEKAKTEAAVAELERVQKEEQAKRDLLTSEKEQLAKQKEAAEEQVKHHKAEVDRLTGDLEKLREDVTALTTKLAENEQLQLASEQLKKDLAVSQQQSVEFESRLKMVETEREVLKMQVSKLKVVQQEKQTLELEQTTLKTEMEALKLSGEKKREDDFETQKTSLQNTVETTQVLLQQKDRDVEKLQNELMVVQGENALLTSRAASLSTVEQEKQVLEQKVSTLERAAAESQKNANILSNLDTTGDPVLTQLKEEKEAAAGQIDFLNSVIVDMQRKNEELNVRLQAMESGVQNGTHDEDSYISAPRKSAPRLFCDICDQFDLHDTDDCPTQAMSDSPPATSYHNDRHQERPYCTICEVFDHWTQDCDDEQTF